MRTCKRRCTSSSGKRSIPTMAIGSGGGHDCAVFAGQGVASAMLFIRNDGGSHNPAETMEHGGLGAGC